MSATGVKQYRRTEDISESGDSSDSKTVVTEVSKNTFVTVVTQLIVVTGLTVIEMCQ